MKRVEDAIHRTVVEHLRTRGVPNMVFFHVPNGGKRSKVEAAILKGFGVRAGVSDLIIIHRGRVYALELKAPNGRPTKEQMQFMSDLNLAGGFGCIAEGLDQAICVLECWGLLRGKASIGRAA